MKKYSKSVSKLAKNARISAQKYTKNNNKIEKKSYNSSSCSVYGGLQFAFNHGLDADISASIMWGWYRSVAPLNTGISIISEEFSNIAPRIYNKESDDYLDFGSTETNYTKVLELLNNPNIDETSRQFFESMCPSKKVTGDLYFLVTANDADSEPLEIYYIQPQSVTPFRGSDGRIKSYHCSDLRFMETFSVSERFIDGKMKQQYFANNGKWELLHFKNFNTKQNAIHGLPQVVATLLEIEQYWLANTHNNTFIKKGARPSGMLIMPPDVDLSEEQEERLRKRLEGFHGNSGEVLIVQGGQSFTELATSNKDMDYINLMTRAERQIYNALRIPTAPLIEGNATYDNLTESRYSLFLLAVMPFANTVYSDLDESLRYRYKAEDKYILSYNPKDIPALKISENRETERQINTGLLTINEGRRLLNHDEIENGNALYNPRISLTQNNQNNSESKSKLKSFYIDNMIRHGISNKEAEEKARKLYG